MNISNQLGSVDESWQESQELMPEQTSQQPKVVHLFWNTLKKEEQQAQIPVRRWNIIRWVKTKNNKINFGYILDDWSEENFYFPMIAGLLSPEQVEKSIKQLVEEKLWVDYNPAKRTALNIQ